ncbi:NAD(P)-dependent oxidoreductase [bacterium]|nr:NAD(P)-dependent oxidoreductase [bacterium]
MKRVLLTGATGFIGRYCLPLLSARSYEVYAVSSKTPLKNSSDVHWHQANLLDQRQVSDLIAKVQPTHLLHLAWFTNPGEYWSSVENLRWVQAGLDLLLAFVLHGGQRAVFAGTCAEYDWKYGYCSEQLTPLKPVTLYGSCKHALQVMTDALTRQSGFSTAWGRIFYLYGPHEHPNRLISSVIRSILQEKPVRCSHGNQIRDFLYVQDVAGAFVTLLESDVIGPVNIASGHPVTLREIIFKIAEKLNREDLIHLGMIPTPVNDPHLLVADTNRLFNKVGWLPKHDLDRGLEKTILWWSNQLGLVK